MKFDLLGIVFCLLVLVVVFVPVFYVCSAFEERGRYLRFRSFRIEQPVLYSVEYLEQMDDIGLEVKSRKKRVIALNAKDAQEKIEVNCSYAPCFLIIERLG